MRFQLMAISQRDSSLTPQLAEQIVAQVRRRDHLRSLPLALSTPLALHGEVTQSTVDTMQSTSGATPKGAPREVAAMLQADPALAKANASLLRQVGPQWPALAKFVPAAAARAWSV